MSAWHSGKVEWFDKTAGEGVVRDSKDGSSYYVHYSTIISPKERSTLTSKSKKKHLEQGSDVRFQLFVTPYVKQVGKVEEL